MLNSDTANWAISILSVFVAAWQGYKNYNLNKYIKAESIETHESAGILLGAIQNCLKEINNNNIPCAGQQAGRTEGLAQALFDRSIKTIYLAHRYNRKEIHMWIANGKIKESIKEGFLKYAEK